MDGFTVIMGALVELLGRACGLANPRVGKGQSIPLAVVAFGLACAGAFAMQKLGPAAAAITVVGTLIAGVAGGLPQPYPVSAAIVAGMFAYLGGFLLAVFSMF